MVAVQGALDKMVSDAGNGEDALDDKAAGEDGGGGRAEAGAAGPALVKATIGNWSNGGQTVVKRKKCQHEAEVEAAEGGAFKTGQIMVKLWSNYGQIMAGGGRVRRPRIRPVF